MASPWFNFLVALVVGLLLGLERERGKGEGPGRRSAGIRTFAIASLVGAIALHLGDIPLLAVATGGVVVLAGLSYFRGQDPDPGLTTEIGLIAAPLLGGLAMSDPLLAAGLGAVVAVVFAVKAPLHGFVTRVLSDTEVKDGLIFAVATLVIWPLLPDRGIGPMQALNLHSIWLLVVLILALGACGYVATRALGARFGLPLAGLASGFVSSTATIGSMAGRVARDPASMNAAVAGASFSTVATFVQMALLLMTVSEPTLILVAPALAAGGVTVALYGLIFLRRGMAAHGGVKANEGAVAQPGQVFSVGTALGLAAMMAVMLTAAAVLKSRFGEIGVVVGATIAGLVDTHAAAISVASLAASDTMTPRDAAPAILAAMTSNALAKIAVTVGMGSAGFAMRLVPGLIFSMAVAWIVAGMMILR